MISRRLSSVSAVSSAVVSFPLAPATRASAAARGRAELSAIPNLSYIKTAGARAAVVRPRYTPGTVLRWGGLASGRALIPVSNERRDARIPKKKGNHLYIDY